MCASIAQAVVFTQRPDAQPTVLASASALLAVRPARQGRLAQGRHDRQRQAPALVMMASVANPSRSPRNTPQVVTILRFARRATASSSITT